MLFRSLWKKGETSGHTQKLVAMRYDCDHDAMLLTVEQVGPACHTGAKSCFFNDVYVDEDAPATANVLQEDYATIADRAANPVEGSYTNYLLDNGVEKICKKVGEEASETIIAAMKANKEEVTYEAADLLYHLTVISLLKKNVRAAEQTSCPMKTDAALIAVIPFTKIA